MNSKERNIEYVESSGNVFADLGIPEPEEAMAKVPFAVSTNELEDK